MSELRWSVGLSDNVSGPAKQAASGLASLEAAFKKLDKASSTQLARAAETYQSQSKMATRLMDKAMSSAVSSQLGGTGKTLGGSAKLMQIVGSKLGDVKSGMLGDAFSGLAKADGMLESVGMSLGGVVTSGAVAATGAIIALGAAIVAAASAFAGFTVMSAKAFTEFAVKTAVFREDALVSFETILKSKSSAQEMYQKAISFASKTPFTTTQVVSAYQQMLAGGFQGKELDKYMMMVADLSAIKGMEKMPQLIGALSMAKGAGTFTGEVGERFRDAGLPLADVARKLNKTDPSKLYGMKTDVVLNAIAEVVREKFGGAADKKSAALSGLWSTLESRPFELFSKSLGDENGLGLFMGKIKGSVKKLGEMLDPDSGHGRMLVTAISALGKALSPAVDVAGSFLQGAITGLAKGFDGFGAGLAQNGMDAAKFGELVGFVAAKFAILSFSLVNTITSFDTFVGGMTRTTKTWSETGGGGGLRSGVMDGVFGSGLLGAMNVGGYGFSGMSLAPATAGGPTAVTAGREAGGPISLNVNISGAGLTPDELMARARAEFTAMLQKLGITA